MVKIVISSRISQTNITAFTLLMLVDAFILQMFIGPVHCIHTTFILYIFSHMYYMFILLCIYTTFYVIYFQTYAMYITLYTICTIFY
jgi:hypothetical protein